MEINSIIHEYSQVMGDQLLKIIWQLKHPENFTHNIKDKILKERKIHRKIYTLDDIYQYLDENIPSLPNIKKAFEAMENIFANEIPIGIIGDYDVDGICSTALIHMFFKRLNHKSYFFIGDRQDGYGPTSKGFETLRNQGAQAFIILDSGSVAKNILDAQEGTIIVLDHHIPDENHQPKNAIIVNPQIDNHPMAHCCTGGLVFSFIYGLKQLLSLEINLDDLLTIAGITTVCDVMNLSPLNSMYIQITTQLVQQHIWPKVFDFLMINKITKKIPLFDEEDLGFLIGPHINSIGRLCSNKYIHQLVEAISQDISWPVMKKKIPLIGDDDAYQIALHDDKIQGFIETLYKEYYVKMDTKNIEESQDFIEYIAILMMNLNIIRKQRQKILMEEITNKISKENNFKDMEVFGFCSHLPESFLGVVGIVSAKMCENFYKPAFIGIKLQDKIKGSIRSIDGVNIGLMMIEAKEKAIIIDGGGHAKAGGFTVLYDQWDNFLQFAHEFTRKALVYPKEKKILIDYILNVQGINNNLLEDMIHLKPFGEGNPKLQFLLVNCMVIKIMIIKQEHLMITLDCPPINYYKKINLTAWSFFFNKNQKFQELFNIINKNPHTILDFVIHIGLDKSIYIIDYKIKNIVNQPWIK